MKTAKKIYYEIKFHNKAICNIADRFHGISLTSDLYIENIIFKVLYLTNGG